MRVLVVGLGLVAQRHIRNLKAIDDSIEIACWRQRPEPEGWQPPAGLPVTYWLYDPNRVQQWGPDAAIIANPASMHTDTALLLAGFRCHVFIEKPISDSLDRLGSLLQTCQNRHHPVVLMVGYDLRFYRPLQLVHEAIQVGRIGRSLHIRCEVGQYLPDWRPGRDYRTSVSARRELGGGVLLELSHEIDYARWLMGELVSVSAMTGKLSDLEIDVEDTADLLLRFESGAMGSIHLDMVDRATRRSCRIVGTDGTICCDLIGGCASLYRADWMAREWLCPPGPMDGNAPFVAEMRHFLACCRGEAVPVVSGEDARSTLAVMLAAKRSAEGGGMVAV